MNRPIRYFGSRLSDCRGASPPENSKKRTAPRTHRSWRASHFSDGYWRCPMRVLSCVIALVLVLAESSLAGSADRDLPGVGAFTYCGSPIVTPSPEIGQ